MIRRFRTLPLRGLTLLAAVAPVAAVLVACGDGSVVTGRSPAASEEASTPAGGPPPDAPRVVTTDPPPGATDVDPSRSTLSVTFDREMDRQGWAWVVEDEATAPEVSGTRFGPSGRTATAQVELEPGRDYVVWINSESYRYFKGVDGTSAVPFRWTFSTRQGPRLLSSRSLRSSPGPEVVELEPPNGATGVDPERDLLRVTFDRPMEGSWAWVREPGTTPPPSSGDPRFTADRRTNELPVDLAPETTYTIWLNSRDHMLFRDAEGRDLDPVRWTFTTGGEE